ncbi:MAG: hypothetical protein EHM27_00710 [Deltaproteobacteria bacterium]|nr:MAG: hypothetical protein EHM27_00710 [Deltaproteobacteria bacterium]
MLSALIILMLVYFYSHYGFASTTAHITAMFPAFLAVAVAAKVPALFGSLNVGFFLGLECGHYPLWDRSGSRSI